MSEYSGGDFDVDAFFASNRPALGLCDFELIGGHLFSVGVPVNSPLEFKKMVLAAGTTYALRNKSIDRVLK